MWEEGATCHWSCSYATRYLGGTVPRGLREQAPVMERETDLCPYQRGDRNVHIVRLRDGPQLLRWLSSLLYYLYIVALMTTTMNGA